MKRGKGTALTMIYSTETFREKFVFEIHISTMLYFSLCYNISTQIYTLCAIIYEYRGI